MIAICSPIGGAGVSVKIPYCYSSSFTTVPQAAYSEESLGRNPASGTHQLAHQVIHFQEHRPLTGAGTANVTKPEEGFDTYRRRKLAPWRAYARGSRFQGQVPVCPGAFLKVCQIVAGQDGKGHLTE